MRTLTIGLLVVCLAAVAASAYNVGIFVPGYIQGSPLYEDMVAGVDLVVAANPDVTYKAVEAGFDQSTWGTQMVAMAATEEYDLILTSNGAMPEFSAEAAEQFPNQKWLIVDSVASGDDQFYTVLYNQIEQAGVMGYLAGLVTQSDMAGANADLKVGFIAGQEYAALNNMIKPGYDLGVQLANPSIEVDFRILGNWYDAGKAGELANSMIDAGVDVIMTACGGANAGVIGACEERGAYVLYIDKDNFELSESIIGCASLAQVQAVYEYVTAAVAGELVWGEYKVLGIGDGYVDFVDSNPLYAQRVSADVVADMGIFLADLRSFVNTWLKSQMVVPVYW